MLIVLHTLNADCINIEIKKTKKKQIYREFTVCT